MTRNDTELCIQDANGDYRPATTEEILAAARSRLNRKFRRGRSIQSPDQTKDYLIGHLADEPHEILAALYLDCRHRILAFHRHFTGTIDGCTIHPRVIVKQALDLNAAALILAHQHPSGTGDPSRADERITRRIKDALDLIEVRLLDHIIVAGTETVSLAERGLI